jgi:hypothetical protein
MPDCASFFARTKRYVVATRSVCTRQSDLSSRNFIAPDE